jgi:hypothetical protein
MSHTTHRRPLRRRSAGVLVGTALALSALAGGTTAEATPNATDLEGTVLRIGGAAVTGSNPIPAGRTLTPVRLTTTDPDTSLNDGYGLTAATPGSRITRNYTSPATPAEEATFRIDGTIVATTVPGWRATSLRTDAGVLPAIVFTAEGATYAVLLGGVGASTATRTVANSSVGTTALGGFRAYEYGLLPVGAQTQVGTAFSQGTAAGVPTGTGGLVSRTLIDEDAIRGNGTRGEELMFVGDPEPAYQLVNSTGNEVVATVSLRNGSTFQVNALSFPIVGYAGYGSTSWLFDRAGLAAAGATIADVTGVIAQTPTDHSLTWQQLGFDIA